MSLTHRGVDASLDREFVNDLKVLANQACGNPRERAVPPEDYRSHWLSTGQPAEFWASVETSQADPRTIADVWLDSGRRVGWAWTTFRDVHDYALTIAELQEIAVVPERRREGIGAAMLQAIIGMARDNGATLFRSETAIGNTASLALHTGAGLRASRMAFSIELSEDAEDLERDWILESAATLRWLADRTARDARHQPPPWG